MEKENNNPIEDLKNIRSMMEKSSKFLSLSGLSGVFAGLTALIGAFVAHRLIHNFNGMRYNYFASGKLYEKADELALNLAITAALILIVAVGLGLLFTAIKAKKNGQKLNHPIAFKVLWSGLIPLVSGGAFTILLYFQGAYTILPASTLVFYGLSLLNAAKYLNVEIKYLAISEIILGLLAGVFIDKSLLFWAIGFGVLHIFYGAIMYFRYDRQP